MIARHTGPQSRRTAPALRFLLVCIGGWVLLRVMMNWNPAIPEAPPAARPPWSMPSPFAAAAPAAPMAAGRLEHRHRNLVHDTQPRPASDRLAAARGGAGFDRHGLRLAMMAPYLQSRDWRASALPGRGSPWAAMSPAAAAAAAPATGEPFWMQRPLAGWSLGGWLYLREGSGAAPGGIAAGGQLGGSQAGMRLAYGFGESGRLRAFGRATVAVERARQRELAFGLVYAPLAQLPVDIALERRVAVGREGRDAFAAMVMGGVSDVPMPAAFRLDAYAQAGVVGARRTDLFADGAVVIDRRLGADERSPLRLGALAAGAAQPGAERVDVGPRLTLRLPEVGKGGRIALDWRHRIAGDARPDSGFALTLAAGF